MSFARAFLIAAAVALPVQAACPVSSFGAEKAQDCARKACGRTRPSPEIQGIQRGAYFEYVSLDVMPADIHVWLALDLDRGEIVYTQAYPARSYERLLQTRKQENAATRVSVRKVQKQVHYTRRRAIAPAQLDEIVCVANALWKAKEIDSVSYATDIYLGFFLVDGTRAKSLGGMGLPIGDVKKIETLLDAAKDPDWEWWDVF